MKTFGNVAGHTLQRVLKTFGNVAAHTLQRVLKTFGKTFGNVATHTECVAKCLFFVDVRSGVRREPTPHEA